MHMIKISLNGKVFNINTVAKTRIFLKERKKKKKPHFP